MSHTYSFLRFVSVRQGPLACQIGRVKCDGGLPVWETKHAVLYFANGAAGHGDSDAVGSLMSDFPSHRKRTEKTVYEAEAFRGRRSEGLKCFQRTRRSCKIRRSQQGGGWILASNTISRIFRQPSYHSAVKGKMRTPEATDTQLNGHLMDAARRDRIGRRQ